MNQLVTGDGDGGLNPSYARGEHDGMVDSEDDIDFSDQFGLSASPPPRHYNDDEDQYEVASPVGDAYSMYPDEAKDYTATDISAYTSWR